MKTNSLKFILFFNLSLAILHAQYVNREFQEASGTPSFVSTFTTYGGYYGRIISSTLGGKIIIGHVNSSGQGENAFIKRISEDGQILFTKEFNTVGTSNNEYATDVIENPNNGDIYLSIVTDNGGLTNYDAVLMRYDANGAPLDSAVYSGSSGLNDVPTAIKLNPISGNIIVAISNENTGKSYDYLAAEYSTSLAYIQESPAYDFAGSNLPDVPIGIEFDAGGNIILLGASATGTNDWDYTCVMYDVSTLSFIVDDRVNMPGFGFDQPAAFCKDPITGDIFITGRSSSNGINYDIRTVRIAANLSGIIWNVTHDENGLEDAATSMVLDTNGNVLVGGYITNSIGKKEMFWRKYNPTNGATIWTMKQAGERPSADAYVKSMATNTSNNSIYFVAAQKGKSGFDEALTGKIDNNGKDKWQRAINNATTHVIPSDIITENKSTYVISVVDGSADLYQTTGYEEMQRDTNTATYGSSKYLKNQLIVRFLPESLDSNAIDNLTGSSIREFADLSYYMKPTAYSQVTTALEVACGGNCDIKAAKIFPGMSTTFTSAVSRMDETIPMANFWTALLLFMPEQVDLSVANNAFNDLKNVVAYSHPNYMATLFGSANDSLFHQQHALNSSTLYPNAGINIDDAWKIMPMGGKSFVRLGVYDTGVDWEHKDFGYDGIDTSKSKIVDGWDFDYKKHVKKQANGEDRNGHGSAVMGLIGAIRNNTIGISGIAGSNDSIKSKGLSLYSYRLFDGNGSDFYGGFAPLDYIAHAMLYTSLSPTQQVAHYAYVNEYCHEMNIQNHSWGLYTPPADTGRFNIRNQSINLISEALHKINRLKVTAVAARGHAAGTATSYPYNPTGTVSSFPANNDDDWVISVTGTGTDGKFAHDGLVAPFTNSVNAEYTCAWGGDIDIAAPSSSLLNVSLVSKKPFTPYNSKYLKFGYSSSAAPQVAAAVGLMMSHLNDSANRSSYVNMAPEDCESILQLSATDTDSVGYDRLTGYGRLNVGRAMKLIQKDYHKLLHFGTNWRFSYNIVKTLISSNDTIRTTEGVERGVAPKIWLHQGKYRVNTYEITSTVFHPISNQDTIIAYWPRSSSSMTWPLHVNKKLLPREKTKILSLNQFGAVLRGYVYQVWDSLGNYKGWWPVDTSYAMSGLGSPGYFAEYSVLTRNYGNPLGLKENSGANNLVNLFPNPTSGIQTLEIKTKVGSTLTIEIYDIMGRKVKEVFNGKTNAQLTQIENDVSDLVNSMYIYNIKLDGQFLNQKFIKH